MKYIRTKNGIYRTTKNFVVGKEHYVAWHDFCEEIIAQADSIEKLCDEFVLHYGDTMQTNIPIPWATYERRDDNWQNHKERLISELKKTERKAIVYGAIWTNKGLIYLARMNKKGDLKLL